MGMEEYLGGDGIAVVEWASQCPEAIPETVLTVRISPLSETDRQIDLEPAGGFRDLILKEADA